MRQNISCRVGQGVTQTRVAQWSPPGVYTRGSAKVGPVASVLLDRGGAGGVVSGLLRVKGPVVEGLVGGLRQEGYRDIRSEKECVTLALCGETLDGVRCESDRIQLPEQRYFGADWWVQSKARERERALPDDRRTSPALFPSSPCVILQLFGAMLRNRLHGCSNSAERRMHARTGFFPKLTYLRIIEAVSCDGE